MLFNDSRGQNVKYNVNVCLSMLVSDQPGEKAKYNMKFVCPLIQVTQHECQVPLLPENRGGWKIFIHTSHHQDLTQGLFKSRYQRKGKSDMSRNSCAVGQCWSLIYQARWQLQCESMPGTYQTWRSSASGSLLVMDSPGEKKPSVMWIFACHWFRPPGTNAKRSAPGRTKLMRCSS